MVVGRAECCERVGYAVDPADVAGISEDIAVAGAACSVTGVAGTTVTFSHHSAEYFAVMTAPPTNTPCARSRIKNMAGLCAFHASATDIALARYRLDARGRASVDDGNA